MDPGRLVVRPKERLGEQDSFLGIHRHLCAGDTSTVASLDFREDPLIFLGKGADRDIVYVVGFPSLCYQMLGRVVIDQLDNQTM